MKKLILVILILLVVIPLILYYFKYGLNFKPINLSNNKQVNTNTNFKNNGFLNESDMAFPKDTSFTKATGDDKELGNFALYYDYNPHAMSGVQWVYTQKVNSKEEYLAAIQKFDDFYNLQIHKNGWSNEVKVEGNRYLQPLAADGPSGSTYGYVRYADGKVQVILLFYQIDNLSGYPANVQFRVFLSDVKDLSSVIK